MYVVLEPFILHPCKRKNQTPRTRAWTLMLCSFYELRSHFVILSVHGLLISKFSLQKLSRAVSRDIVRTDRPGLAAKISRGGEVT